MVYAALHTPPPSVVFSTAINPEQIQTLVNDPKVTRVNVEVPRDVSSADLVGVIKQIHVDGKKIINVNLPLLLPPKERQAIYSGLSGIKFVQFPN